MRGSLLARVIGVQLVAGGWLLLRYYFGVPFDVMLAGLTAVLFVVAIGWPIGWVVGHYISRDSDVDTMAFKIIAGVNLIAWIVPVAGVALSRITLHFSRRSEAMPAFYWLLAGIGGWGAIANAGIGGAHQMQIRSGAAQAEAQSAAMAQITWRTERSTERCPYAARESWSREDVDKYCRGPATANPDRGTRQPSQRGPDGSRPAGATDRAGESGPTSQPNPGD